MAPTLCAPVGNHLPTSATILAGTPDQLRDELLGAGVDVDVVAPERGVATPLP